MQISNSLDDAPEGPRVCPNCESANVLTAVEDETFQYGQEPNAAAISVSIPVYRCQDCEFAFTGHEAELIRHNAVCKHLGILNPDEVRAVREGFDMSQANFSAATGIGTASLARWESGSLLQNKSVDTLLFLLTFPENMARLKDRVKANQT